MRGRGLCPWSHFDAASGTGESVVAGAGDDACAGNRALQSDAVKAAVGLEVRGLVDEAILVALFGFDGLQVLEDLTAVRIDEEPATGLLGQVLEGSEAVRELARPAIDDGVDGGARALANIDGFAQVDMAGVVFAIAEEQDEVAGFLNGIRLPLIAAGGIERIENGGEGIETARQVAHGCGSCGDGRIAVGPLLADEGIGVELLDEGAVVPFAEKLRGVGVNDGAVEGDVIQHRRAGVKQETSADGKVVVFLQHDDGGRGLAIVGKPEVAAREMGEGLAAGIGSVKGERDFVDRDAECVRRGLILRGGERDEELSEKDGWNRAAAHTLYDSEPRCG